MLARMPASYAVIGDVQWLPGYCVLLTDDPAATRLSDLAAGARAAYLESMARLAKAVEIVCGARDPAFRRVNVEILGQHRSLLARARVAALRLGAGGARRQARVALPCRPVERPRPRARARARRPASGADRGARAWLTTTSCASGTRRRSCSTTSPTTRSPSPPCARPGPRCCARPCRPSPATIADLGCGTGSVSVLLAELGYAVHGIDVSPEMVVRARAKASAHAVDATFAVGDAGDPRISTVDVVLTRHVAWAVPDLDAAVGRWVSSLRPGGRLVLVEGLWSNGAGVAADALADVVRRHLPVVSVRELEDPALWGYPLEDSRYLLTARAAP